MATESKRGDSNRITRDYFDALLLRMRHVDAALPRTTMELYGQTFSTPVMTAALSHMESRSANGMVELAKGAYGANAVMWAGMGDEDEIEAITATGARTIKIIKPYAGNDVIFQKIRHAEQCGALAVGMDVDHAFNGKGQYDVVAGKQMRPKSLDEIKSFIKATQLPFIIKGVLSEQDAEKSMEAGAGGIVVSHHHGIMDYAVPPLMILPRIKAIIGETVPVFVDCGVASGMDAFKALALGATAVCVGRALIDPLKANGAKGVQDKIEAITNELAGAMARTACADLAHIDASVIWKK